MLYRLSIRNFAIIDRLDLEFGSGFNVLTGETGAGKSILLDALNMALGGRGGAEIVRSGAEKAVVDAEFETEGASTLQKLMQELGYDLEDDRLLITREISAAGKSTCRICGRPASVSILKQIGDELVDLHGQHEHQMLLSQPRQMEMLDGWGGHELTALREETARSYQHLQKLMREKEELETDSRERVRLLDLYGFQVQEIENAGLENENEEMLEAEYRRATHAQRLIETSHAAAQALGGEEGTALQAIALAERALEEASHMDDTLQPVLETLRSARYELVEIERDLLRYAEQVEAQPEHLQQLEERLETVRALKRKYGDSIEEILTYLQQTRARMEALSHSEERTALLHAEIEAASAALKERCVKLSLLRRNAAENFEKNVTAELCDLALDKARFEVRVDPAEYSAKGADRVEFLLAANPGEPLKPLAKVASGGEISRVMLAIKSALARQETLPTMVFDEIDVGVGGRTAALLAEKMAALAQTCQIIAITHLARIASSAAHHYTIEKEVQNNRAATKVRLLDPEERVVEIARMIGGTDTSEVALQNAREMLSASL